MLRESQAAVVARNEVWRGHSVTEPYEAGWASEALVFVRALSDAVGAIGEAWVELSPDGQHWAAEGTRFPLPTVINQVTFARIAHFGTWLRIAANLPAGAELRVLVTYHLKA
jgi:hypothetical protein